MKYNLVIAFCLVLTSSYVFALPIDWNGRVGFESNTIKDFRRGAGDCATGNGSTCVTDGEDNARFQSYVFRLDPTIIVNDSATVKAELTTSSYRGGFLGQNSTWGQSGSSSYYNVYSGNNGMSINKAYAELYADTALFRVGKFAKNFGLGAIINDGDQTFDRFFSAYDGLEAEFKIGNFNLIAHWAKIYSDSSRPTGKYDILEKGLTAQYENPNTSLQFGVLYALREVESSHTAVYPSGPQDVSVVDVFISKQWEKFDLAIEVPMLTGDVGSIYNGNDNASFDTNAYIAKLNYNLKSGYRFGLTAGMVKGDDGTSDNMEAMYLHPNFQIARLMYRYNYYGFNDASKNIFDSAISNSTFMKWDFDILNDAWTWKFSYITAKANEVASEGKAFYSHETSSLINNANEDQDNSLGHEIDIGFNYLWNPSINVGGYFAYHFVGDYYEFDNDSSSKLDTTDVMSYGLTLDLAF